MNTHIPVHFFLWWSRRTLREWNTLHEVQDLLESHVWHGDGKLWQFTFDTHPVENKSLGYSKEWKDISHRHLSINPSCAPLFWGNIRTIFTFYAVEILRNKRQGSIYLVNADNLVTQGARVSAPMNIWFIFLEYSGISSRRVNKKWWIGS